MQLSNIKLPLKLGFITIEGIKLVTKGNINNSMRKSKEILTVGNFKGPINHHYSWVQNQKRSLISHNLKINYTFKMD